MRKFKSMKNNEEEFNKKFEEDLKEIKEKLHAEKLSDEFKANLQARLEEELNKPSDKKERKIHFPAVTKRLAAACACLIIFFSSCITFADDIENVIFKIFGNTDKVVEEAIANGNYKKIDMEYVEDNGVSIKVDYVVLEENQLYIAFNVLSEKEFDETHLKAININDQKNYCIYSSNKNKVYNMMYKEENISNKNSVIIYDVKNEEYKFDELSTLKIKCDLINIIKGEENKDITGVWELEVNIK